MKAFQLQNGGCLRQRWWFDDLNLFHVVDEEVEADSRKKRLPERPKCPRIGRPSASQRRRRARTRFQSGFDRVGPPGLGDAGRRGAVRSHAAGPSQGRVADPERLTNAGDTLRRAGRLRHRPERTSSRRYHLNPNKRRFAFECKASRHEASRQDQPSEHALDLDLIDRAPALQSD